MRPYLVSVLSAACPGAGEEVLSAGSPAQPVGTPSRVPLSGIMQPPVLPPTLCLYLVCVSVTQCHCRELNSLLCLGTISWHYVWED